ncbi:WhiB family transcriptional regulator [Streptosporangium subroseum]|uniref:WhiB family transcriptional regulator n=1 Tax=Streptosporangium subroseum TaxID=106412 RepID=UPI003085F394|nr:WhiB family transcriptional regulator [Streptosporangium subroseum]
MSAPTVRLLTTHPALSLLAAITDGMPSRLAEGALCGLDPELHTGPDVFTDEPADERAAREQVAREVCAECPVRALCLARALELRPDRGVWAGISATDLLAVLGTTEQRTEVA